MAKVLVVDDDPQMLMILEVTLLSGDHEAVLVKEGKKALDQLEDPAIEAVLLDVMLPDMSGWEVLQEIRANPMTEQVPVIMLSSRSGVQDRVRGIRTGADGYLPKPFDPEELLARIEGLLGRTAYLAGHQGRLEVQSFQALAQSLEQNRRSGTLEISAMGEKGRLVVRQGRMYSADFLGLKNTEAVLAMAGLDDGSFRFLPSRIDEDATDAEDLPGLQVLLMDAAWVADELKSRALPVASKSLVLASEGEIEPAFDNLPFAAVIEGFGGASRTTLTSLLQAGGAAPDKIRLALAILMEQGAVRVAT
jgi:DNA-binding response OmpR family regulator